MTDTDGRTGSSIQVWTPGRLMNAELYFAAVRDLMDSGASQWFISIGTGKKKTIHAVADHPDQWPGWVLPKMKSAVLRVTYPDGGQMDYQVPYTITVWKDSPQAETSVAVFERRLRLAKRTWPFSPAGQLLLGLSALAMLLFLTTWLAGTVNGYPINTNDPTVIAIMGCGLLLGVFIFVWVTDQNVPPWKPPIRRKVRWRLPSLRDVSRLWLEHRVPIVIGLTTSLFGTVVWATLSRLF